MTSQHKALNDSQWNAICEIFPERKRKLSIRLVLDALFYVVRTGCQWRNLPSCHPKWTAVYYYFDKWTKDASLENVNILLNELDRVKNNKNETPSLLCIDSQSVKLSPMMGEDRGIDGNKRVNGRKREFLVDTDGRIWGVAVHAANIADGKGGLPLIDNISNISSVKKILGDTAYNGIFADAVVKIGCIYEKSARIGGNADQEKVQPKTGKKFIAEAKRWVVERTIGWTNFFRRITKDYERTKESSESWLLLANITIMLQRI